jgi:hypothetical protein
MGEKLFFLQFVSWHLALLLVVIGPRGSYWIALIVATICFGLFFYDLIKERKILYSGVMSALIISENVIAIYYVKHMSGHFL